MTQLPLFDNDVLGVKLHDAATTPGFEVELAPSEADELGAFDEHALGEADAAESTLDLFAGLL
jgi:hypothetical protein